MQKTETDGDFINNQLAKLGIEASIPEIPENLKEPFAQLESIKQMVTVPDVVERKTNALVDSYEKISTSADQMFESIEQMKAAANTFQESKNEMLNDFKDLPTDLLEANSFQSAAPELQ